MRFSDPIQKPRLCYFFLMLAHRFMVTEAVMVKKRSGVLPALLLLAAVLAVLADPAPAATPAAVLISR